ncbi:MAG: thioester reductase domain-containing protein [Cyanobacteria bacterium P01_F01_bin.116]
MLSPKFSTIVELLQYRATYQPDKIAYTFLQEGEVEAGNLSYQELGQQANSIATYLKQHTQPGDRALLLYPPSGLEFISAFMGCLYAGVVAVPAHTPRRNQKLSRLEAIVNDAQPSIVLTTLSILTSLQQQWPKHPQLGNLSCIATDQITTLETFDDQAPIAADTLAFLQYTSGSTGNPKGVMVSHGNILYNQRMIKTAFQNDEADLCVGWLPLFHDMGLIGNILQSLYVGTHCVLMSPAAFLKRPIRWLQAISDYGATTSGGPNFAYDLCVNRISSEQKTTLDLSSWQLAFNGAEPIRAKTLQRFSDAFSDCGFQSAAFYPCYGMAETTLLISGGTPAHQPVLRHVQAAALEHHQVNFLKHPQPESRTLVSCGSAVLEQDILIVEPGTRVKCQLDQVGEIWVAGEHVAQGYWNQAAATEATFSAYVAGTQTGPYLRTGDLGFVDSTGELFVTGRLKDVIIIRGRNYYPQDIEHVAQSSHAALSLNGGAAFSVDVDAQEQLVIIHEVERHFLRNLNVAEIVSAIRQAVSDSFGLQVYSVVLLRPHSLLKTSSGKVKRQECCRAYLNDRLNQVGRDELEAASGYTLGDFESKFDLSRSLGDVLDDGIPRSHTIKNWLTAWLAKVTNVALQSIEQDRPFSDYGIDSVTAMALAQDLEDWLSVSVAPGILWDFPTINALGEQLAHQIAVGGTDASMGLTDSLKSSVDLATEAVLDPAIQCGLKPKPTKPRSIFLTGATGFLGAFLLSELLEQTTADIYCLVRAADANTGKARIQQNLENYHLWKTPFQTRIIPIVGNLSQPQFGLCSQQFQALIKQIDVIYHNGALLNYVYPYNQLKATNVLGTQEVLRLASSGVAKPVHYISSTAVFDYHVSTRSIVNESTPIDHTEGMYLGYAQSKWVADRLVQVAGERGLPVYIYRPSFIGGHSQTGVANSEDIIWRIIKGSIQMGYMPEIDIDLDITPVDYVSKNIVALSQQNWPDGNVFHLNHPNPMPWNELVQLTQDFGYHLQPLSLTEWLKKIEVLVKRDADNILHTLTPFLLTRWSKDQLPLLKLMEQKQAPKICCQETLAKLARLEQAIACPALDKKLWDTYFNYSIESDFAYSLAER